MKRNKKRKKESKKSARKPGKKKAHREIDLPALQAIVEKAKASLVEEEHTMLKGSVETLAVVTQELEQKGTSIARLRKLIFGARTEKTTDVLGKKPGENDGKKSSGKDKKKKKPKGHGRNGSDKYTGAEKVPVEHESLKRGDDCPECEKGKLYPLEPEVIVRITGMAPLGGKLYELEKLRCNLCGMIFKAKTPEGVSDEKYDETAAAMIAMLRYASGMPFVRLERLQDSLGIPLPRSTQWDVVRVAFEKIEAAYDALIRQAAQGEVVHNDDTTMRILGLERDESDERTGVFTTGILSTTDGKKIALFFTGKKHAGENLEDLLAHRASGLSPPVHMCDGLSHNTAGDFDTIVANCLAHARRRYVDVANSFPDEVEYVLETLREVYKHEASTRGMEPGKRLAYHQEHSGPLMEDLEAWCKKQFDEHLVEPNSGLGEAIEYMQKHWEALTLFLRVPGAPLDNNSCERALKKAIIHRKNSLFYKTERGAHVGDGYMSLIYTCELHHVDPFDYLVALQRNEHRVASDPDAWMPWNYQKALEGIETNR